MTAKERILDLISALPDPEITELFEQFLELDPAQRDAVKLVLRDLLAWRRLEATFQRRAAS